MPDIDDLTFFDVVRTVSPVPDGVLSANVVFEAQVTRGLAIQADVAADVIEVLLRPVHARIVDGVLMKDGIASVSLLSAAEVAIEGGFSYLVTFTHARVDGVILLDALKPLSFEALNVAGTFDLKDAAAVVSSTAVPAIRGPRGYGITGSFLGKPANQAAMLAITGAVGDWVIRLDTATIWVVAALPTSTLGNWVELDYPSTPGVGSADTPRVLVWTGSAWPNRPNDDRLTFFVGGDAPGDAPTDIDRVAGDMWFPANEPGGSGGVGTADWSTIAGKPPVVAEGADQAQARASIGAGTSDLTLGTTGSTAKVGNYQPTAANISDSTAIGRALITASTAPAARTAAGVTSVGDAVFTAVDQAAARAAINAEVLGGGGGGAAFDNGDGTGNMTAGTVVDNGNGTGTA